MTDYAKLRRLPFYYGYSVLTATAVLCGVGANSGSTRAGSG
jgi:hypothetical protein